MERISQAEWEALRTISIAAQVLYNIGATVNSKAKYADSVARKGRLIAIPRSCLCAATGGWIWFGVLYVLNCGHAVLA